jgi:hypothetical protein
MVGDRALGEQGLHPMDFSNDWVRAYDGDGVAGIGYQFPGSGCHFDLCALSQDVLRPFTRALGRAFGG